MADTFSLEVIAPNRVVYSGEVEMVRAPGTAGSFQVLPGHLPLVSTLEVGELDLREPGQPDQVVALSGGFVEVLRGGVCVLAESAEFGHEIDIERARQAEARARERLQALSREVDRTRADAALNRAMNRLRLAGRTTI